ncbi:MAG: hypothetical protein K8L97_27200 [Anaerolineae bacterium]|nr:hypothetical protein [Anaerolineae bacterium]
MNSYLKIDRKALKTALEQAGMKVVSLRSHNDGTFTASLEDTQYALPIEPAQLFKTLLPFGRTVVLLPGGYDLRFGITANLITSETITALFKALAKLVQLADMMELSTDELASRVILTDIDTVATSHVEGTLIHNDENGRFYYLPENPFVQYMLPIGPQEEPLVDAEHARWLLNNDREGVYMLHKLTMTQDIDGRILAIERDSNLALIERNGKLSIEPASERILVWRIPDARRRVSYRLEQGWYGPEVSVEVFPNPESWSSIRVSYRSAYRADYKAEVNWYSTSGGLAEAAAFHDAYGLALIIAHRLDAMGLSNE